jgi:gliding motility-associated-like protein
MDTMTIYVQDQVVIPNAFTPNGDGVNDKWAIQNLDLYQNCTVRVFNRWGQNVYSSIGYAAPWDGTYKGAELPAGTYYYIIDLKNNTPSLSGFVALLR